MKRFLGFAAVLLLGLTGCNKEETVVVRDDSNPPDGVKIVLIQKEKDSYKQARKQMEKEHELIQREMKYDLKHHTWHEVYPYQTTIVTDTHIPSGTINIGDPIVIDQPNVSLPPTQAPPQTHPQPANPTIPPAAVTPVTPPTYTANNTKKAVIVGINKYPGAPLSGCVNDASDIRGLVKRTVTTNDAADIQAWIKGSLSMTDDQIVYLTDRDATTANIMQALIWLVADTKSGDIRLFWYSGHGAEYAGSDVATQPDHQNQVMCPVDFDWSEQHMIMDVQLHKLFATMPNGVVFNWGSDSCHSGDLTKGIPKPGIKYKSYPIAPPPAVAANLAAVKAKRGITQRGIVAGELEVGFLSGCTYDELSADTQSDGGRPGGAMTIYFLKTLNQPGFWAKPLTTISAQMNQTLDSYRYEQHPQSEGSRKNKGWLQP